MIKLPSSELSQDDRSDPAITNVQTDHQATLSGTHEKTLTTQSALLNIPSALILLASTFIYQSSAQALEFQCEAAEDVRFLKVNIPGQEHLCEVSVTHERNNLREVQWHARNDTLFCSAKAYELRDNYENLWGYNCTAWPDRDGIDPLSPRQRLILDQRLKAPIAEGKNSAPIPNYRC